MLSLTSTLREAQESASAAPHLRVTLHDRDVTVVRLRWTRWYTGVEPDGPAAAAIPDDDALVRARIDPGAGTLHVQRVAAPSGSSDYTQWTALGAVSASPGVGCAAAAQRVLLTSVNAPGTGIEVRESTDGGATWSAATIIATAGSAVTAVAGAVRSDGSAAVFYAASGSVSSVSRTGLGAWGAPVTWSQSLATIDGLAAANVEDYAVLVSGTDSSGQAGVWATLFGSGLLPAGFWLPLAPIALASAGTGVSYLAAGLANVGAPRASIVERSAVERVQIASTVAGRLMLSRLWREPRPLEETTPYGLDITSRSEAFLVAPAGVWHSEIGAPVEDLSDDVVALELTTAFGSQRARLTLSDEAGRYLQGAAPIALAPGGELLLEAGYQTSAGSETVEVARMAITSVARELRGGRSLVTVELDGAFGVLDRWRAPSQLSYAPGGDSLLMIVTDVARRAGIDVLISDVSAELTALKPPFTVRAGQRGGAAVRSLLERVPDVARPQSTKLVLFEPDEADTADYAYGVDHAVDRLELTVDAPAVGAVRVFGAAQVGEELDVDALERGAATVVVVDDALDSAARVDARAATVLRRAELETEAARLVARPNVGQEIGDVVEVTDATLGLDAARYRVAAVRFRFSRDRRPLAEMQLTLTAP